MDVTCEWSLGAVALSAVGALVGLDAEVHGAVVGAEVVAALEGALAEAADVPRPVGHVALVHVTLVALGRPAGPGCNSVDI